MRKSYLVAAAAALSLFAGLTWLAPRSVFLSMFAEIMWPGAMPARWWAHNLESNDTDLVRESLAFLTHRADPVAVPKALRLLRSSNDYIWPNAAEYLGACNRQEAVPYLIKALRHTAWQSDEETVRYLRALTGQPYGASFEQWQAWWTAKHPGESFDWTSSLGAKPRTGGVAPEQAAQR
jgi:hypothetical protein